MKTSNLMKMVKSPPNGKKTLSDKFDENGRKFSDGKKTLWEKQKLLVSSKISISHSVLKRLVLQICKNQGLFGKGLNTLRN